MILDEILSAVLQVIAFTLIPFIVYLIWFRKKLSFPRFVGWVASTRRANALALLASLLFLLPPLILAIVHPDFRAALSDPTSMTGKFSQLGWSTETMSLILITAIFKTSLSEEIFFRGFVAKRLIAWIGFQKGNIAQALIFGLLHVVLFIQISTSISFLAFMLLFPLVGAYVSGYLNEKLANGSILPGWIAHGVANVGSYTLIGLVIL